MVRYCHHLVMVFIWEVCDAYHFKLYKSNRETVSPFKNCSNHTNLIPILTGNTVLLYLNGYGKLACLQLFSQSVKFQLTVTTVNRDLIETGNNEKGNDVDVWLW